MTSSQNKNEESCKCNILKKKEKRERYGLSFRFFACQKKKYLSHLLARSFSISWDNQHAQKADFSFEVKGAENTVAGMQQKHEECKQLQQAKEEYVMQQQGSLT